MCQRLLQLLAIHFHPLAAQQNQSVAAGQQGVEFCARQSLSINSHRQTEVEQRIDSQVAFLFLPDGNADLRAAGFLFPPVRQAHQQTGLFKDGSAFQKFIGLFRQPDQRVKDIPCFHQIFN